MEGRIDKVRLALHTKVPVGTKKVSGSVYEWTKFKGFSPCKDEQHGYEHLIRFDLLYDNYVRFCTKNEVAKTMIASVEKFGRDMGTLCYPKKNNIGDANTVAYLVACENPDKSSVVHKIPSIIEELNVDALLREAHDEEEEGMDF